VSGKEEVLSSDAEVGKDLPGLRDETGRVERVRMEVMMIA